MESARFQSTFLVVVFYLILSVPVPLARSGTASLQETHFTNVTEAAGVDYVGIGEGVAWGDYDGDGDLDLFVSNLGVDLLFENLGDETFSEVGADRGVADSGYGRGTAWADYDNNGEFDLFLLRDQTNLLYRNDGTGHFTNVAEQAGLIDNMFQRGMAWADYDGDGLLDLYCSSVGGENFLYRNTDGLHFENVAALAGVENFSGTEGTAWGDFDDDGHPDLYVTSKYDANTLYRNMGNGQFEDVTEESGTLGFGTAYGVAWADYDNDLDLDFYVTTKGTRNFLFQNNGDGTFTDVTEAAGVEEPDQGTGIAWGDYDNDGWIDLYVLGDPGPNNLYHNEGGGTFTNITEESGAQDPLSSVSVGLAAGDYNDDGFLDLYIANVASEYILFRNDGNANSWLKVVLIGIESNRSAFGAKVVAHAGDSQQMRIVGAGCGFQSQNSLEVELGFGQRDVVDLVEIFWPSGLVTVLEDVPVNQVITVAEGELTPVLVDIQPLGSEFAWGDTLRFHVTVTNLTGELQVFDAWTEVLTPWGFLLSPVLGPETVYLSPHHSVSALLGQVIPRRAPLGGAYIYTLKAGVFPDEVWSDDSFEFSIVP